MDREKELEKRFAERLDRILAGQETPLDTPEDAELRRSLEFARKMSALQTAPSAQFQSQLKARLLQKLAVREALKEEKQGAFWNIFRRPAFQLAVAAVFVAILVTVVWRAGYFQPAVAPPPSGKTPTATTTTTAAPTTTKPAAPALLSVTAGTDKTSYSSGEPVKIIVDVKNTGGASLSLANLPPILSLMQSETRKPVYTFKAGSENRTLGPNEVARFNYLWNQTDFAGQKVSGSYYVELEDLQYKGQSIELDLPRAPSFYIEPGATMGGGARIINVEQSRTNNGMNVILKTITISDTGVKLDAVILAPAGYTVTKTATGYRANKDYSATAVYSLDGNWIQEAGVSSVVYLEGAMNHTWFIPALIPPQTSEFYFEITGFGDIKGSWQFTIPLN